MEDLWRGLLVIYPYRGTYGPLHLSLSVRCVVWFARGALCRFLSLSLFLCCGCLYAERDRERGGVQKRGRGGAREGALLPSSFLLLKHTHRRSEFSPPSVNQASNQSSRLSFLPLELCLNFSLSLYLFLLQLARNLYSFFDSFFIVFLTFLSKVINPQLKPSLSLLYNGSLRF